MDQGKQDGNPTVQQQEKELYGHQEDNPGHQTARKRMLRNKKTETDSLTVFDQSPSVDENDTILPMPEADPTMDPDDWRARLLPDSRRRIVNKIMETLERHLPFRREEALRELRKMAVRFEEKIFTAATSQSDYLTRISLKMSTMETRGTNHSLDSIPILHSTSTNTAARDSSPDCLGLAFAFGNIILEALSAAFDQASSPKRSQYAFIGLIMSLIAVAVCIVDFFLKARKEEVYLSRWGYIWWFFTEEGHAPFGSFPDIFGSICAIFQCIFASIQYAYCIQHAENPIKISLVPLVFAICVACSRLLPQNREPLRHGHIP